MNTTKEETIRALLDDVKVASVEVCMMDDICIHCETFDDLCIGVSEMGYSMLISGWTNEIKSFEVNLVPTTEFNAGDIVWGVNIEKEGVITDCDDYLYPFVSVEFKGGLTDDCLCSDLILIKKGDKQ